MQGSTLRGHQVVQMRQAGEQCRLTPTGMMEALHHKPVPVDGVLGLIQDRAHRGHLRVGAHRLPPRLPGLKPAPHSLALVRANGRGAVVGTTASALPQRHDSYARALATAVAEGVALRASTLAPWRTWAIRLVIKR